MISRPKIATRLAFLICFIALITLGATKFFWYQSIWWFDMPMHFLGGIVLVFLLVYLFYSYIVKKEIIDTLIFLIIGVVIIGVSWEIFEYIFNNLIGGQPFIIPDTLSDICFDMVGAITGIFLVKNKI